jgi:hypothetical protein
MFRFPSTDHRTTIVGRTGSGKTYLAYWLLGKAHFDKQPYIIVDYKQDELLNTSNRFHEIGLSDKIPSKPGIYIVHPRPDETNEVEAFLWKVWKKTRTGLYIDEGYLVPDAGALQAIYTTGRSRHIPIMLLSQRPLWVTRFAFSEVEFFAAFHLNDKDDEKRVRQFTPRDFFNEGRLAKHHSRWYDVGEDFKAILGPVPNADILVDTIEKRLAPKKKWI